MKLLQTLLENEDIQNLITENEEIITSAASVFHEFPQVVKDYISENLSEFLVPGDLEATYENMVTFTESASSNFLHELTRMVNGEFDETDPGV